MGSLNWASGLIPLSRLHLRPLQRHFRSLGLWTPLHRAGRPYGGFQDFGYLDPFRQKAPYQRFGTQSGNFGPSSLGYSDTGPPSYDSYGQNYLVSYIDKQDGTHNSHTLLRLAVDLVQWLQQGGTHSHSLLRLVVDLVQWLQLRGIAIRARHISDCLNVIEECLSQPNQPITTERNLHPEIVNRIFVTGGMFATFHNTNLPQFMSLIPEPRALAIALCSVTGPAGMVKTV